MTTRIAKIFHEWMGWCPNAPAKRTASACLSTPLVTANPLEPDGGSGGTGRFDRGIGIATGSIRTLIRERQLLWFSFLTGCVMAFMFFANYALQRLGSYPFDAIDLPRWLILTFAIELCTVFCLTVLLAGLILCLSPGETGRPRSYREGLSLAKSHLRPLAEWSVIIALCGTALYAFINYVGYTHYTLSPVLSQFPFNFIRVPEVYSIGPIGGTYAISYGVTSTLILSGINIMLCLLSLFFVPMLVLESKQLPDAVAESVGLVKKCWRETVICFLLFGLIFLAVSLTALLFRFVYSIVYPDMLLFWRPGAEWIAGAALYMLVWFILAMIGSTAGGISLFNLYTYAKTGRMPEGSGEK